MVCRSSGDVFAMLLRAGPDNWQDSGQALGSYRRLGAIVHWYNYRYGTVLADKDRGFHNVRQ